MSLDTLKKLDGEAALAAADMVQRPALDDLSLDVLFREARTHSAWLDRQVPDSLLEKVYELARMPPTVMNAQPLRLVFVKSAEAKERLKPALSPGNVEKTMTAPVTAIAAWDTAFYDQMPILFPSRDVRPGLVAMPEAAREKMATASANLQIAYLILAARSLGLDCGPMGGFDNAKVDAAFFPDGKWRSLLLVNLGYGNRERLFPRNPRLDFGAACRIE
jgi:3-hydroxypropanoate dehydrogenase